MIPIASVEEEAIGIKSFMFNHDLGAKPGQFVMAWLPGVNMKPVSVGMCTKKSFMLTIAAVGQFSEAVCTLKVGDVLGIQGPYGTGYTIPSKQRVAMVAGGYGAAPLHFAAVVCIQKSCSVDFILGARTKGLLIYQKRLKKLGVKLHILTDDGSAGERGYATDCLERLLKRTAADCVMTCGPELMQRKAAELCASHSIPCEVSLERYMKCGFGICGTCCADPTGQSMCTRGPVMRGDDALKITEFGVYHRDGTGMKQKY